MEEDGWRAGADGSWRDRMARLPPVIGLAIAFAVTFVVYAGLAAALDQARGDEVDAGELLIKTLVFASGMTAVSAFIWRQQLSTMSERTAGEREQIARSLRTGELPDDAALD